MGRRLLLALALLAFIFGGLFLWRESRVQAADHPPAPPAALTVSAVAVRAAPERVTLDAVGSLDAVRQVTLAPEVAGRVVALQFDAGSAVRKGQLIVQLFDEPERAKLASIQAKAAYAKRQLDRSQALAQTGAEPRNLFDRHRFDFDAAAADIRETQAVITQKAVRAPFDGVLGLRRVNLGQYLNAGDAIATLTDLDTLYANFTVPQKNLSQLRLGQSVSITTDAYPERTLVARVSAIEPQIGTDTRNVAVQATLPNPDHLLRPGMYIQARLELPPRERALTVPDTAVQTSLRGESVLVVGKPGRDGLGVVRLQPVRTGRRADGRIAIADGLRPGDVVVTSGQVRLAAGDRVKVALDDGAGSGAAQ
ncbi:efflux RND transporter periplasmic adaptor subunit [Burkholderia pseudomallei]|uniref:efflux RND transporter periplasmic adaptor subunit n=1 Tax=Burkholderia pseudomallei TaxID=28450 RepID=UPI000A1A092E|nr:efflux RND transporter periplasmic adaptor subunit [Burkholderia pseudomallei]ARK95065.1 efflux transporter periplasmic adaptor subunit [Burkholderia pseudomallei]MBK3338494.1 efflux RND transporter periplasmic adaptor subunit [Burkholderia pseudomallei]MBO2980924.1 efflux RND transporter periplasmic adaptor subunit [Burkholderia pseudomallei]MBO2986256.1 efflux RND transporter periplasmic adaptor subunit [Burkholderia pseudomallei]MBO3047907.1 efflux RND transporter periplasmic adaptor sub